MNFMEGLEITDVAALVAIAGTLGGSVYALSKYLVREQAHKVVDGELKRLNKSITELTQTIVRFGLQIDNLIKTQDEQHKLIDRHDKTIDDHSVRIARLEEHVKGD